MSEPLRFSAALRERSNAAHSPDEAAGFMTDLVSGRASRDEYIEMLGQLWFVYDALENAGERMRRDPVARVFLSDRLTRLPAIETDLAFLIGEDWRLRIAPRPATARYVARIRAVGATWPGGFVAHHYTRYLGDLSGGACIGRVLQRRFGFDTNGIGFYLFGDIADPKAFKDVYREQLDRAPWDDVERERVTAEVLVAYRCNTELFAELAHARSVAIA
jgi:heme oxygenase (biliverdin-producing, ferredoxin)